MKRAISVIVVLLIAISIYGQTEIMSFLMLDQKSGKSILVNNNDSLDIAKSKFKEIGYEIVARIPNWYSIVLREKIIGEISINEKGYISQVNLYSYEIGFSNIAVGANVNELGKSYNVQIANDTTGFIDIPIFVNEKQKHWNMAKIILEKGIVMQIRANFSNIK